jgi:hypothetical protein
MPALLVLVAVLGGAPTVSVSGVAQRHHITNPCMGGAAVTPDMIQHERAPLVKQRITFIAGSDPSGTVVARTTTDAKGTFRVALVPGTYCVLFGDAPAPQPEAKKTTDAGSPDAVLPVAAVSGDYDPVCMRELAHPRPTCQTVLAVTTNATQQATLELVSSNQCAQPWAHPCWRGPMPP